MTENKNLEGAAPASSEASPTENKERIESRESKGSSGELADSSTPAPSDSLSARTAQPDADPQPAARTPSSEPSPVAPNEVKPQTSPTVLPAASPQRVYQASTVRKTILSFVFLLLLPFFASLPAMMVQRIIHQLWPDMLGFTIFAVAFAIVMLLLLFELIHSIRARVTIGESSVQLTLPAARGISMPKFFYKTHDIPYSDIETVETRREVYGGAIAPVMLRGARIVTKSGQKISLGYVNEANVDPLLPVPEIAAEIARRAGVPVVDHGTVRRQVHKKIRGIRATDDAARPITEEDIAALNRRHNNVMIGICGALFLLVSAGLMVDISRSDIDLGERAHQLVQTLMKPL
ncbi:MAG: hypothetical protein IRZ15_18110, partial [Bryobacteraceae bacterium]|nr:hypothetical protein [Bryobacteraceae bacterium]